MAKHQKPPEGSDTDGETGLDEADLAQLLREQGGQHAADDEEGTADEADEE
ncbi:MAG: hypothetical protein ACRDRW_08330 [Pseudonocardiaceae bacterium]